MPQQFKIRFLVAFIFLLALVAGFFDVPFLTHKIPSYIPVPDIFKKNFQLGLDLQGGAHLLYQADLSGIAERKAEAMASLRDAIERRINIFGVSEPVVQVEQKGTEYRLVVELAGVKDIKEAIRIIGETPFLQFRELNGPIPQNEEEAKQVSFVVTELDGKYLDYAQVAFDQNTSRPYISIQFTKEGGDFFAEITKRNIKKPLGIFLDGALLSAPVVQETITGGKAQITGTFSLQEVKELVRYLNAGSLPVPISLLSQQTVEASLGEVYLKQSLQAGTYGLFAVMVFMLLWYRLPGLIAIVALSIYTVFALAIFKFIPVTLTTAGIAGFILSIGMAVDANILVFERMKEELRHGKDIKNSILEGFRRAWTSIRDSNVSSLITSAILYWFGTSIVRGFALTLAIGILISMFTAITVTRGLLLALLTPRLEKMRLPFLSGFSK